MGFTGPLAGLARGYLPILPIVALAGVAAGVLEGVGVTLLIPLLGLLMTSAPPDEFRGPVIDFVNAVTPTGDSAKIVAIGVAMIGFLILKAIVQTANQRYIFHLYGRFASDIRQALCKHALALDYDFFLRNERVRLIHIMSTESWNAAEAFRQALLVIPAFMMMLVFGFLLLNIDFGLACMAIAGAIVIQVFLLALEWRQRRLSASVSSSQEAMSGRMLSVMAGMRAIRIFGQQAQELEKFVTTSERVRHSMDRIYRISSASGPLVEVFASVVFVVILMVAILKGLPLPTSVTFLVLLSRIQPLAQTISKARVEIASLSASISEVQWFMAQRPMHVSLPAVAKVPPTDRPIAFKSVSFEYPDGSVAIHDATFTLQPGVSNALIGHSGAGKSTIVSLLCNLVRPTSGEILLGEADIGEFDPDQWRSRIGIAGQDIDLLDGTIAANIAYGKSDATPAEIEDAARMAGALKFILALPQGFETRIGLEALSLSGGQRQRIGLARALIRKPDLLILDEATSAVDAMSESEIVRLLKEHRNFRTALIISHRKSTVMACEFGIVIDHGRVIEEGPLQSLSYFSNVMA